MRPLGKPRRPPSPPSPACGSVDGGAARAQGGECPLAAPLPPNSALNAGAGSALGSWRLGPPGVPLEPFAFEAFASPLPRGHLS